MHEKKKPTDTQFGFKYLYKCRWLTSIFNIFPNLIVCCLNAKMNANTCRRYIQIRVSVGPKLLTSQSKTSRWLTCYFVSNEFTGLNFSDAPKQTLQFFLGHVLRQIVDYQVSFTVLYAPWLYRWGAVVWDCWRTVACVVASWPIGQLCFHGSNYLLKKQKKNQIKPYAHLTKNNKLPDSYCKKKDALHTLKHCFPGDFWLSKIKMYSSVNRKDQVIKLQETLQLSKLFSMLYF